MRKSKRLFRFLLKAAGLSVAVLIIFFLGFFSHQNKSVRDTILSVKKLRFISYSNYSKGQDVKIPRLELIISDSSKTVIETCRENAIAAGILRDENKIEVPALLLHNQDTFEVNMRLKGDYSDHWNGSKWSYRIKMKGEQRIFGMQSFSIQDPETRGNLNEWYFHKLMKREGLVALRYAFVSLTENGVEKGTYAIEESFNKQLIEFNNRREAPILKFDESILIDKSILNTKNRYSQENLFLMAKIDVFKSKRTLKDDILYDQFQKGKHLLNGLRNGSVGLDEALDIDKAARLFAIADLIGGHHSLRWKNVRFYFNPVIGKLELIGFDSNSGHYIPDIYYNRWNTKDLGDYDVFAWKDIFFRNSDFVNAYFKYLEKYSDPSYLTEFHEEIKMEMELYSSYIYKENSMYRFFLIHYTRNAELIAEKIAEYKASQVESSEKYYVEAKATKAILEGDKDIYISLRNNAPDDIEIFGVFDPDEKKISQNPVIQIRGRRNNTLGNNSLITFHLYQPIDSIQSQIKRKGNLWVHKKMRVGYRYLNSTDTLYTKFEHFYDPQVADYSKNKPKESFSIDHHTKTVTIQKGKWVFEEDVIFPAGYGITCTSGTEIVLNKGATFVANGPISFIGQADERIKIKSDDTTGSFLAYQTNALSSMDYVDFITLSESHQGPWHISGGVNFYEANVDLNHVRFFDNKSEDALNIVRSKFSLKNATFNSIFSDAFDGDFCEGKVSNTQFYDIGNDALDFSGSHILLSNIKISGVEDKGISGGEMSKIMGSNISITNAEIGLVSKDLSYLKLDSLELDSVAVGFTAFKKKEMFGPAKIDLFNYSIRHFTKEYLLEKNCYASLNGTRLKPNELSVIELLYGNEFGKKSN